MRKIHEGRREVCELPATGTTPFVSPHIVSKLCPSSDDMVGEDAQTDGRVTLDVGKLRNAINAIIDAITIVPSK